MYSRRDPKTGLSVMLCYTLFWKYFFWTNIWLNTQEISCTDSDFWHLWRNVKVCQHQAPEQSPPRVEWLLPMAHSSHSPHTCTFPPHWWRNIFLYSLTREIFPCSHVSVWGGEGPWDFFSVGKLLHLYIKPDWPYWHLYFHVVENGGCFSIVPE